MRMSLSMTENIETETPLAAVDFIIILAVDFDFAPLSLFVSNNSKVWPKPGKVTILCFFFVHHEKNLSPQLFLPSPTPPSGLVHY